MNKIIAVVMIMLSVVSCAPVYETYIGVHEKLNIEGLKIISVDTCSGNSDIQHIRYSIIKEK